MPTTYRCDVPGCRYGWRGPTHARDKVALHHLLKRHEALAEAIATLTIELSAPLRLERQVGCCCPMEVFDPECTVHAADANW